MKTLLILTLSLPILSGCGIIGTAANVAKTVVTVPVKVLTLDETQKNESDYLVLSDSK